MLPLSGLRVIAVEQYGAGPFGSMMLGDLGAEVIKIENPADGGDVSRSVGPHFFADGDSHFFQAFNRNKKSVTLNLKHPRAKDVLHRLVRTRRMRPSTTCAATSRRSSGSPMRSSAPSIPRSSARIFPPTAATGSARPGRATTI